MQQIDPHAAVTRLRPGDRVEVIHQVRVGLRRWTAAVRGVVAGVERRRCGLHFRRNPDDKMFSDMLLLVRDDGERTAVALDEFTEVRKLT